MLRVKTRHSRGRGNPGSRQMLGHKSCRVELVFSINSIFHGTIPLLDVLLALDGLAHVLMLLKLHKIVRLVRPGKTRGDILLWTPCSMRSRVSASDERSEQRRYPTDLQWDSA